jgi:hypothetical protein
VKKAAAEGTEVKASGKTAKAGKKKAAAKKAPAKKTKKK